MNNVAAFIILGTVMLAVGLVVYVLAEVKMAQFANAFLAQSGVDTDLFLWMQLGRIFGVIAGIFGTVSVVYGLVKMASKRGSA